jgi:hypothetical protein
VENLWLLATPPAPTVILISDLFRLVGPVDPGRTFHSLGVSSNFSEVRGEDNPEVSSEPHPKSCCCILRRHFQERISGCHFNVSRVQSGTRFFVKRANPRFC